MQNFVGLYKELSDKLSEHIENISLIDLWNFQVFNQNPEQPVPTPSIFLGFRSSSIADIGLKIQNVTLLVDVFLFYKTLPNTNVSTDAADFLNLIDNINTILHGSQGEHYSSMRRVSFVPVDTEGPENLWNITYSCTLIDYSAQKEWEDGGFKEVETQRFDIP